MAFTFSRIWPSVDMLLQLSVYLPSWISFLNLAYRLFSFVHRRGLTSASHQVLVQAEPR